MEGSWNWESPDETLIYLELSKKMELGKDPEVELDCKQGAGRDSGVKLRFYLEPATGDPDIGSQIELAKNSDVELGFYLVG